MSDTMKPAEDLAVTMIELNRLQASPTQPRKHFDQEKLDQLTESMREHGFTLSALTVRPLPGDAGKNGDSRFEIVTGERRWRAAAAAGIVRAPCFVRNLSNEAVVEQQLIENIQREDLTPIEEAEGYKQILALVDHDGKKVYSVASLAKRIGKKERWIFQTLALCNLDPATRAEVESGRLSRKTARFIGVVPDEKLRAEFAREVLHPQKEEGPLSWRKAEELLHRKFVRDLRVATFDQEDPSLLPMEEVSGKRLAGGACTDCPFRTGNTAQAGELAKQKHSVCLNPSCYDRKQAAEWLAWQARETSPEKKRIALNEVQCKKLFAFGNQISPESGLVDLSDHPDGGDLRAGVESPGTWRKLTAGAEIHVFVVRDRFMKTRELVKRDVAIEAARTNKYTAFKSKTTRSANPDETRRSMGLVPPPDLNADESDQWLDTAPTPSEREDHRKSSDRKTSNVSAKDQAVLEAVVNEIQKRKIDASATVLNFLRFLVDREISATKPTADFLKRYHLPVGGSAMNQLKRPASELIAIMVDLIISEGGYLTDLHVDDAKWLKSILEIDCKAIEKQVTEELRKPGTGNRKENKWVMLISADGQVTAECPHCIQRWVKFATAADYETCPGSTAPGKSAKCPHCRLSSAFPTLSNAKTKLSDRRASNLKKANVQRSTSNAQRPTKEKKKKAAALKTARKAKK